MVSTANLHLYIQGTPVVTVSAAGAATKTRGGFYANATAGAEEEEEAVGSQGRDNGGVIIPFFVTPPSPLRNPHFLS